MHGEVMCTSKNDVFNTRFIKRPMSTTRGREEMKLFFSFSVRGGTLVTASSD